MVQMIIFWHLLDLPISHQDLQSIYGRGQQQQQIMPDLLILEMGRRITTSYFVEVEHPIIGKAKIPGFAFKMSETPGKIDRPSPLVGEHNEEVFRKYLGLGEEEIEKLKNEGAI